MRRTGALLPFLLASAMLAASPAPADAVASPSCAGRALARLRASSPEGYGTFARVADKGSFTRWLDCGDAQFGLPTAVHEATHLETNETDAFPLVGGGTVARPHEVSAFFPPARIAGRFDTDDFTATYLGRGKASSATDALYLLDEFNAYTHDLAVAVDFGASSRPDEGVDHRDGLAAMMAFVSAYAEAARADEPDTWRGLRSPRVALVVRQLWLRAENVMASSCGIPRFGMRDAGYIRQVCDAGPRSALATILGRAPACPSRCLEAQPDEGFAAEATETEPAEADASDTGAPDQAAITGKTVDPVPRHPFAAAAYPRRHRASIDE